MLPKVFLAPISEFTSLPFRMLCYKYGAEAAVAPLVNVTAITKRKEAIEAVDVDAAEKHVGVQLFGKEPAEFEYAAKVVAARFPFVKFIDINCGCPAKNIIAVGAGCVLLKSPARVAKIVAAAKKCGLPVSVKLRLQDEKKTIAFCRKMEAARADFIAVHGRTVAQGYAGVADWKTICKIKAVVEIPVIGNGDILSAAQGQEKIVSGCCDAFMIGREAMKNPLCFSDKRLETMQQQKKLLKEYATLCEKFDMLNITDLRLKSLAVFRGTEGRAALRLKISETKTAEGLLELIS
ncbi:MAG: tRNA-dihydrouridine synthase family protein [Candidatus Micrarchaeota archaeon]